MTGKIVTTGLVTLAFILIIATEPTAAAQETGDGLLHVVEPGDTWQALAWRYGVDVESLQVANPHPNSQRQPAIGQTVTIPRTGQIEASGTIANSNDGGLLQLSAVAGVRPWSVAINNGLISPYQPLLYRTIFLEAGNESPRQLPAGMRSLEVSQAAGRPGEALAIRGTTTSTGMVTARFASRDFQVSMNGQRFVGLVGTGAFSEPGQFMLELSVAGEPPWSQPWMLVPGEWTFEEITYTGAAAAIDSDSIRQERERLEIVWNQYGQKPLWSGSFGKPLENFLAISSQYGARRSYAGGPFDHYHEGLDFSAYGGTAVLAPASGSVVLAEPLVARGGAVIIDHGLGVFSGYYHLSEVLVEPGQNVNAGDEIGQVGSTGLSTGNHLHWDFLVGGTWVDPAAWLAQDVACWILEGWGTPCSD